VYAETEACAETSPRIASELRKRHSPSWPGIAWDPNLLALNQLVQGSTLLQRAIQTKVSAYSHNRKIALWCQIVGEPKLQETQRSRAVVCSYVPRDDRIGWLGEEVTAELLAALADAQLA
jgi:hypothetical protein